jgi:hypothetical protein
MPGVEGNPMVYFHKIQNEEQDHGNMAVPPRPRNLALCRANLSKVNDRTSADPFYVSTIKLKPSMSVAENVFLYLESAPVLYKGKVVPVLN